MNRFAIAQQVSLAITWYETHPFGIGAAVNMVGTTVVEAIAVVIGAKVRNKLCKQITCPVCNWLQFILGLFANNWLKVTPAFAAIPYNFECYIYDSFNMHTEK